MTNPKSDKSGEKMSQNVQNAPWIYEMFTRFSKYSLKLTSQIHNFFIQILDETLKTAKNHPFEVDSDWPYLNYNFCMFETVLLYDSQ